MFELETGCDAINAFMCRKRQIYSPAVKLSRIVDWTEKELRMCLSRLCLGGLSFPSSNLRNVLISFPVLSLL